MLKNLLRTGLQKLIGLEQYLFVFSLINIVRIWYFKGDPEFVFFMEMIKRKGAILDIGANIGFTTVLLAKRFPSSKVYAFEPVLANMQTLQKVVKHYQLTNIEPFAIALGNDEGEVAMRIPLVQNGFMHGLAYVVENAIPDNGENRIVTMQKMDQIDLLHQEPYISAIKIDVENFEYFVLLGGKNLIVKHKPIVFCELWNNERRLLCFNLMQELGYQIKIWKKNKLIDYNGQAALNFFFVPI